jgi:glyceraldehyde 3-phosphate dehydrogenase
MAIRVAINGFGRIGRLFYRSAMRHGGIHVVAVNDLVPPESLQYMLVHDTMHGRFELPVDMTSKGFSCNGQETLCLSEREPNKLPWKELEVDYVLESTGRFTRGEMAQLHIEAGARRVLLSAPTKTPDIVPTFVYKVNHEAYNPRKDTVISNASCTTNCLAPVAKVIHETFGLAEGLMTTCHSVTATQPTQDGPSHKDLRGGRNGYMNIIPASTGAAKAVAICLPELQGRLTGMSLRVPTADVSVVDLTFKTEQATSLADINAAMKAASLGAMEGVLGYTEEPVASSDFVGDTRSSIFDATAGIELNDRFFKILSWYDNEVGYATRCVDMCCMMAALD